MVEDLTDDDLDKVLKKIENSIYEAYLYLRFLKQLFKYNQNRVDTMYRSASTFFVLTQNTFIEALILRISRVTDPAVQSGYKNVSIQLLLKRIFPKPRNSNDGIEAKKLIDEVLKEIENLRNARNKHIGHSDFDSIEDKPIINIVEYNSALDKLENIFNIFIRNLPNSTLYKNNDFYVLNPSINYRADARALLIDIEAGHRYFKLVDHVLSEETIQTLIPETEKEWGRGYFKHSILQYIDEIQ